MNRIARHLLTTLLGTVIAVTIAPGPAAALELAPPPTEPKPPLWAGFESVCLGAKEDTPGVRWTISNTTNGPHIFSFLNEGQLVYDVLVASGETKSGSVSSVLWEDTHRHFQIIWKSQNTVLAQTKPWFNCVEPVLSASFGPVDAHGKPCAGVVPLTIANSGTQTAQVHVYQKTPAVFTALAVPAGASEIVQVPMLPGQTLSGSYLNHGSHEFFFGIEVVECLPPAPPEPPEPPVLPEPPQDDPPAGDDGAGDGPAMNEEPGEPGGTLEPADVPGSDADQSISEPAVSPFRVIDLEAEIARLHARHSGVGSEVGSGGFPGRWTIVMLALGPAILLLALRRT